MVVVPVATKMTQAEFNTLVARVRQEAKAASEVCMTFWPSFRGAGRPPSRSYALALVLVCPCLRCAPLLAVDSVRVCRRTCSGPSFSSRTFLSGRHQTRAVQMRSWIVQAHLDSTMSSCIIYHLSSTSKTEKAQRTRYQPRASGSEFRPSLAS